MPISCGVLADIALSLPVKTLTLPAIEPPRERTQLSEISEYCQPGRLGRIANTLTLGRYAPLRFRVASIAYTPGGMRMPP